MSGDKGTVVTVTIFLFMIIIGPFVLFWAINTLFGLEIAFTFKTWLAGAFLIWFAS